MRPRGAQRRKSHEIRRNWDPFWDPNRSQNPPRPSKSDKKYKRAPKKQIVTIFWYFFTIFVDFSSIFGRFSVDFSLIFSLKNTMNFEHVLGCFLGSERGKVDKRTMCNDTRRMCFLTHYLQYIVAVGHFRKLAKSEQKSPKTPQTTCSKFMLFLRKKSTKNRPKIDPKSTKNRPTS